MATQFIGHYSFAHLTEAGRGGFSAANGSAVQMSKQGRANVAIETVKSLESDKSEAKTFGLNCYVGKTRHNILSVPQLMENGWEINFVNSGCYLQHRSGAIICEVAWYCGCPWLKAVTVAESTATSTGRKSQGFSRR